MMSTDDDSNWTHEPLVDFTTKDEVSITKTMHGPLLGGRPGRANDRELVDERTL